MVWHASRRFADPQHERWTVDAIGQPQLVQQVQAPPHRLPIRRQHVECIELTPECWVDRAQGQPGSGDRREPQKIPTGYAQSCQGRPRRQ